MIRASGGEAEMQATQTRIQDLIKSLGGAEIKASPLGRREPPLPQKEGVPGCFALIQFSAESGEIVDSLQKQILLWDEVLRVGTIRLGKKIRRVKTPPAAQAARRREVGEGDFGIDAV